MNRSKAENCDIKPQLILYQMTLDELSRSLKKEGLFRKPYSDQSMTHFLALDQQTRDLAQKAASSCLDQIKSCQDKEIPLSNSKRFLWATLKELGWKPCSSDSFNYLNDEDLIEMYTVDGHQVWRNMTCMAYSSYTLNEHFDYRWDELYNRDEAINRYLFDFICERVASNSKVIETFDCPWHDIEEVFSLDRYRFYAKHDVFVPILDSTNRVVSFVVSTKVRLIDKKTQRNVSKILELSGY